MTVTVGGRSAAGCCPTCGRCPTCGQPAPIPAAPHPYPYGDPYPLSPYVAPPMWVTPDVRWSSPLVTC